MANSPSGESMITRVVRLLAALSTHPRPLSAREIAAEAALPVSTTYRLLRELESEDIVTRDTDSRWQHGNRLWEIASRGSHAQTLRDAALPPMEDLVASLRFHVSLSILDRHEVLYLERLTPNDYTVNPIAVAGRLPAHATSSGLVLTAFGPPEGQKLMLRRTLPRFTGATPTSPAELRAIFASIRRNGFVTVPGALIPESTGISVPVFDTGEYAIAALTVIVPLGEEKLEVKVPQLKLAARAIRRRLGNTPEELPGILRETQLSPDEL
jgi:DNA-binding IclR family transcriptional regulator